MFVNGKEVILNGPQSLDSFLKKENYSKNRIAVEINGKIIAKKNYETYMLQQDDEIEIVCFVGGG
ncbi:MAG: sulfur carrier protein ThiS [Lachnospiraceae bacterium]|nr:sulfur carrier protein ThiS [Lachnospiraceae bacterium]